MVDRHALGEPRNVVLDEQSDLEQFRRWADAGKKNGALLFTQLNHPGRQSPRAMPRETVAPSAVPVGGGLAPAFGMPRPQIARMARGRAPKENLGAWSAVALFVGRAGAHLIAPSR